MKTKRMIAFLMIFVLSVAGLPMQGKETAALNVVEKDSLEEGEDRS